MVHLGFIGIVESEVETTRMGLYRVWGFPFPGGVGKLIPGEQKQQDKNGVPNFRTACGWSKLWSLFGSIS